MYTYEKEGGQLLWQKELESPIVAIYAVDCASSNLISIPFNPIAQETLSRVKSDAGESNKPLSLSTFIGEFEFGQYAFPTLADDSVLLVSADGNTQYLPLIEGPEKNENDTPIKPNPSAHSNIGSLDGRQPMLNNDSESDRQDFILYGYYNVPEPQPTDKSPTMQIGQMTNHVGNLPPGQYNDSILDLPIEIEGIPNNSNLDISDKVQLVGPQVSHKVQFPPIQMPQGQPITPVNNVTPNVKPFKIVFTTAAISVAATLVVIIAGTITYRKLYPKRAKASKVENKKTSDSEEEVSDVIKKQKKAADGSVSVGKISFYPSIGMTKDSLKVNIGYWSII